MSDQSSISSTEQVPNLPLCPACEHPMSVHDRVGLRWCSVTQLGVGRRDCVCSVTVGSRSSAGASWAQIRQGSAAR
jgi:hypothetical protein